MICYCLLAFTASLSTAVVSPFPDNSMNVFDPDLETQPGFWTSSAVDASTLESTDFAPEGEDNSDLFNLLPDSITTDDDAVENFLASDGSSCGSQGSSSGLSSDDAEVALDSFSLNSLNARGYFEDLKKFFNGANDSPNDRSCAAPDVLNSQDQFSKPQIYNSLDDLDDLPEDDDEAGISYSVEDFGKCPAWEPEYKEAVCCTGRQYGIYVLRCAPGIHNLFLSTLSFQLLPQG